MPMGAVTAENAKLQYEAGQDDEPMTELTDNGDHITFKSAKSLWSGRNEHTPIIRPDGLKSGGKIIPDNAEVDNKVDVAALVCYLAGIEKSVNAGEIVCTRGTTNGYIINSICVDTTGALANIAGTESTAFSETRGAAGGPPFITEGYIEIGQVRFTSTTAAAVLASEIFKTPGIHQERYNYPLWQINYGPDKDNDIPGGSITFLSALPLIHASSTPKNVYASYAEPLFSEIQLTSDFVPPEVSHAVSSKQVYGATVAGRSKSLGQGSFKAELQDGVADGLVVEKDQNLFFKFFPDKYKTAYILCQGVLGIARTFPAGDSIAADCTISAAFKSVEMES